MNEDYRARIARLLAELGIPADYGRARGVPLQEEATDLVVAALAADDNSPVRMTPAAAAAWQAMHAAAEKDDVTLWPLSGFRPVTRQAELIKMKLEKGQAISEILKLVAAPGYSEHHTGRALDIGTPNEPALEEGFALTDAYGWLLRRAAEFGFALSYPKGNSQGFAFEPWHWCFREGVMCRHATMSRVDT